jgi:hypothetical protein
MAEPLRKDEELTTADLVGRSEKPKLVRRAEEAENATDVRDRLSNDAATTDAPAIANKATDFYRPTPEKTADISRPQVTQAGAAAEPPPLFSESDITNSRSRWSNIQAAFVDEPRRAVEDADSLVASLMKKLAEGFANERERLEKQWDRGEDVSTEDLRIALQRYRSFFDRLLKA